MWIKKLELKNFGPHVDLSLEFKRGLVGVFGPNGSGKSTVTDAIYSAVTGDFGRFDGVKTDCVHGAAAKDEESYVRACFEHLGREFVVTRRLRGKPSSELTVDGGERITNANSVESTISELIGVSRRTLDLFVFKPQASIYDFMVATDAERKRSFQSLCRTEGCEKLWSMLGDAASAPELVAEVEDNSDELTAQLAEIRGEVETLKAERETRAAQLLNDKSKATAEGIVRKCRRAEDARLDLAKAQASFEKAEATAAEADVRSSKRKKAAAAAADAVTAGRAEYDEAVSALKGWAAFAKTAARGDKLRARAAELNARKLRKPKKPDSAWFDTFDRDAAVIELGSLRADVKAATKALEAFDGDNDVCPTCGSSSGDISAHLAALRGTASRGPKRIEAISDKLRHCDDYAHDLRLYEKQAEAHASDVAANAAALAEFVAVDRPSRDKATLEAIVDEYVGLVESASEAKDKADTGYAWAVSQAAEVKSLRARVAELEEKIAENDVPAEKAEKAAVRLSEHSVALRAVDAIDGRVSELSRSARRASDALEALRAKIKRGRRLRAMAKVLRRARDVFHRDGLPNRVAVANLSAMEGDVNECLGRFGDPFWVETDDSLRFVAHKPGQPPQPAGRLSTGQKVLLAVSFWLSVASLWKSEVGMLVLDEPTANLDEDNKSFLGAALKRLTKSVRGSRQIIMVTHADGLRSSFDQVVDVGASA